MALQRDTVPVSLASGMGQKVDDNIAGPNQSTVVSDAIFDKEGRLTKRFGQSVLAQTVQNAPGNASFGPNAGPNKVFAHENQLCLASNGNLYSQVQGQNAWNYVGPYVNVGVSAQQVDPKRLASDMAVVGGITVLGGGSQVFVMETATGVLLAKTVTASPTETVIRVIGFQGAAYVLTCDIPAAGTSLTTTLNAYQVNLSTGQLGPKLTLASDLNTRISNSAAANLGYSFIDVAVTSSSSAVGEVAVISYYAASTIKLLVFKNGGSAPLFPAFDTNNGTSTLCGVSLYCEPSVNSNVVYAAMSVSNAGVYVASYTLTASGLIQAWPMALKVSTPDNYFRITMALDPQTGQTLNVYYDTHFDMSVGGWYAPKGNLYPGLQTYQSATILTGFPHSFDCRIAFVQLDQTGAVIGQQSVVGRGLVIAAKAFRDTVRGVIYLPVQALSILQSTYFLFDVTNQLNGRPNIQAKWDLGLATNAKQSSLFIGTAAGGLFRQFANPYVAKSMDIFKDTVFYLPPGQVVSLGQQTFSFAGSGQVHRLNFRSSNAASSAYIARTTHLTGGLLWAYDGAALTEQNFLMYPEIADVCCALPAVSVYSQGSTSAPQINTYTFQGGSFYQGLSGYYTLYTPSNSRYIWFKVDGIGVDPAPSGLVGIQVNISSTDTAANVAFKAKVAVQSVVLDASFFDISNAPNTLPIPLQNQFLMQAKAVGAVTQPTVVGLTDSAWLTPNSSYQYSAIYRSVDRNGNVHRSAPLVGLNITTSATVGATIVTVSCPAITTRFPGDVEIEIYRTLANGTTLYKLSNTLSVQKQVMSSGATRIQFKDTIPDQYLNSNEILYTDGGVMENFSAGACTSVSTFKNRLLVTLIDDPTAVYYSRQVLNGEPVYLSESNAIRFGDDSTPVTATAQMDDKLCVLKERSLFITAGDGSNDLGQGETFQLPIRIPGDYGTLNPNSLILSDPGLIFQTPTKGIHVLTRGMSVEYIGAGVDSYRVNVVSSAVQVRNFEHIVFGLQDQSVSLVYNTRFGRWDTWTNQGADSGTLWQNKYVRVSSASKVYVETTNYFDVDGGNLPISMAVETVWLKMKNLQSFARVYAINFLGTYLSPHVLYIQIGFDFDPVPANYEMHIFDAGTVIGQGGNLPGDQTYQVDIQPGRQKCNAIKIKLTEVPGTGSQASAYFNAIDLECGLKQGLNRLKQAKSV